MRVFTSSVPLQAVHEKMLYSTSSTPASEARQQQPGVLVARIGDVRQPATRSLFQFTRANGAILPTEFRRTAVNRRRWPVEHQVDYNNLI